MTLLDMIGLLLMPVTALVIAGGAYLWFRKDIEEHNKRDRHAH